MTTDPRVEKMKLWAWVGEDELGSGEVGLKQGLCPAGFIPLVACVPGKMNQEYILTQMRAQSQVGGKVIRLVRFTFEEVLVTFEP